jgi:hypothetical protein
VLSFRDEFQHFYAPGEDDIAAAMRTGLVVPDTNVLLSLYRFQVDARDELFGALEKLGDKLWIPHQVGLEFHRNRLGVIAEQEAYFSKTEQEFNATLDGLREKVRAFRARIAVDKGAIAQVEDGIRDMRGLLGTIMNWASDGSLSMSDHESDAVRARLEILLGNRVGSPLEPRELEEARREAKRRADAGIPPGYKDKAKSDPTGDYLVWRQVMNEANARKLPVVFVTDDRKEDWYWREHGLTLGARYELRQEMMLEAGVPVLIMTTETFLLHAKTYLDAEVSSATVDQAKYEAKRSEEERDKRMTELLELTERPAVAETRFSMVRQDMDQVAAAMQSARLRYAESGNASASELSDLEMRLERLRDTAEELDRERAVLERMIASLRSELAD